MSETNRRTDNLIALVAICCLCVCLTTILGLAIATVIYVEDIDDRLSRVEAAPTPLPPTPGPTPLPPTPPLVASLRDADLSFDKRNVLDDNQLSGARRAAAARRVDRLVHSARETRGEAALAVVQKMAPAAPKKADVGAVKPGELHVPLRKTQMAAKSSESTIELSIELLHAVHSLASRARAAPGAAARALGEKLAHDESNVMAELKNLKKAIATHNRRETMDDLRKLHASAESIAHTLHALQKEHVPKVDAAKLAQAHQRASSVHDSTSRLLQAL